jgi:protein-tyrosine phosphatase
LNGRNLLEVNLSAVSVLTVCSGNICRSPFAAALLAEDLDPQLISVSSAGVVAAADDEATPQTIDLASRSGINLAGHRARYLTELMVAQSDLILAMSRTHRRTIIEYAPRKAKLAFTVREFARLAATLTNQEILEAADAGTTSNERIMAAIALVSSRKGQFQLPANPADDDVIDPYRQTSAVYSLMAEQLVPAVSEVRRIIAIAGGAA